ncbi:histidine kinase [Leeuwenhoekiella parthenopeia]|uniref:Histidine kinase n=1 Tax=Leeuwenhoekiella parthenopeia TaxID=2890320 RepID=A0ABS8GX44_9FLAO|nr:2TM domain-containing protein [Leeuwenhoekiella parthenopeia]MCC4213143.1 histidine kinase [Leeuwenhoekiella parthenopeia]
MNLIFKEFANACIVGVSIYVVFLLIHVLGGNTLIFNSDLAEDFATSMLYSIVLYMFNMGVFRYYHQTYKAELFTFKRTIPAILSGMLASVLGVFLIRLFIKCFLRGNSLVEFFETEDYHDYWVPLFVAMVVNTIFYSFYYYRQQKEYQLKEQKIIAGTASAQFDALKNQLDPHFLFNSLNVLTSLIDENPDQAQKFTTSLSKVYRYVLEQKNKELVTLEEELAFAKTYMTLLKMRYEDSIIFTMPDQLVNPEAKMVPLALQLVLENAVKHNVVSSNRRLAIRIDEEPGYLVVRNTLQPKKVMEKGSGVGLFNIRQRYALLTSRRVFVEKTENEFIIKLPTLTRQLKTNLMKTENYLLEKKYDRAKEHVAKLKGFYINLTLYCLAIPAMVILNIWSSDFPWAIFPALGWGLGVFFHGAEVFEWNPILGKGWEQRKIQELIEKDKRNP